MGSTMKHALVSLAAAVVMTWPTCAAAAASPNSAQAIDEGGDVSPCVTYPEYGILSFQMSRHDVQRVFDTDGHKTSPAVLDGVIANVLGMSTGHGESAVIPRNRQVRRYRECPDAGSPEGGVVFVEFNRSRDRVVAYMWWN